MSYYGYSLRDAISLAGDGRWGNAKARFLEEEVERLSKAVMWRDAQIADMEQTILAMSVQLDKGD